LAIVVQSGFDPLLRGEVNLLFVFQHTLRVDLHPAGTATLRVGSSAFVAVRLLLVLCNRRMFAAIRRAAARRFVGSILRAIVVGSMTFIVALAGVAEDDRV
jgi:hypothetical protein